LLGAVLDGIQPDMLPIIYFVRHGETDWNAEGRLQGQKDIPLNDLGQVQAAEVGAIIARLAANPLGLAYWSSPLTRTRETMSILRTVLGLPASAYQVDDRLKELTFGRWEGFTWPDVEATWPGLAARRLADKWNTAPPEGESYAMLSERIMGFLPLIDRPSVVVSHGGVGRALMAMIGGLAQDEAAASTVRQGVVYVFEDGRVRVAS
jgi:probable phosphoglycerate mutase